MRGEGAPYFLHTLQTFPNCHIYIFFFYLYNKRIPYRIYIGDWWWIISIYGFTYNSYIQFSNGFSFCNISKMISSTYFPRKSFHICRMEKHKEGEGEKNPEKQKKKKYKSFPLIWIVLAISGVIIIYYDGCLIARKRWYCENRSENDSSGSAAANVRKRVFFTNPNRIGRNRRHWEWGAFLWVN